MDSINVETSQEPDLTDALLVAVLELALTVRRFWSAAAAAAGISHQELIVLSRVVEHGSITSVELRHQTGLSSASVSELVTRLEHTGALARSRRDPDRRAVHLDSTPHGRRIVGRALKPAHRQLERLRHDGSEHWPATLAALRAINEVLASLPQGAGGI